MNDLSNKDKLQNNFFVVSSNNEQQQHCESYPCTNTLEYLNIELTSKQTEYKDNREVHLNPDNTEQNKHTTEMIEYIQDQQNRTLDNDNHKMSKRTINPPAYLSDYHYN